jgi:hypothetical protein
MMREGRRYELLKPTNMQFQLSLRPQSDEKVISLPYMTSELTRYLPEGVKDSTTKWSESMMRRLFVDCPSAVVQIEMEVSAHECPRRLLNHLSQSVFPGALNRDSKVLILPTFQNTGLSLLTQQQSLDVEQLKDTHLERFSLIALTLCCVLRKHGFWADFCDPSTGQSVLTDPSLGIVNLGIYSEVEAANLLLGYDTSSTVGCCRVLKHPKWAGSCYPATMFTNAPFQTVRDILDKLSAFGNSAE